MKAPAPVHGLACGTVKPFSTAWLLNLAHALNWHKMENKILLIILFLSPTLVDFHIPHKEIKMTTEII